MSSAALQRTLWAQLRGRPCRVFSSNLRVKVGDTGLSTYPDVVVVRGEPRYEAPKQDTLLNPTLIRGPVRSGRAS